MSRLYITQIERLFPLFKSLNLGFTVLKNNQTDVGLSFIKMIEIYLIRLSTEVFLKDFLLILILICYLLSN